MNETLKRLVGPLLLLCVLVGHVRAQKNLPYSRQPLNDAANMNAQIFDLPAGDRPFFFRVDLPGQDVMMIQFAKLSHWQPGTIPAIFKVAAESWIEMQDSFKSATSSRRLSLHVSANDGPVIYSLKEWEGTGRNMFKNDKNVQPLRIAADTLTMLKLTTGSGPDTNEVSILYTFLLEDLGAMEKLANDEVLVNRISVKFDSLVTSMRKKWKKQDAGHHSLEALYNLRNPKEGVPNLSTVQPRTALSQLRGTGDIGATLVGGSIATFASARVFYKWAPKNNSDNESKFLGLGYSAIGFVKEEESGLSLRRLGFVNLEFGEIYNGKSAPFPFRRTSAGVGYRVDAVDVGPFDFKYRVFFTYSPTRLLTITPDIYITQEKEGNASKAFIGIGVSIRLL